MHRAISANTIELWSDALGKWDSTSKSRIRELARSGVPDPLRHQVWSRLVGAHGTDVSHSYQHLLKQESEQEQVIRCDLARTFPAHDFFSATNGGQAALYNISKVWEGLDEDATSRGWACFFSQARGGLFRPGLQRVRRGSRLLPGPLVHHCRATAPRMRRVGAGCPLCHVV